MSRGLERVAVQTHAIVRDSQRAERCCSSKREESPQADESGASAAFLTSVQEENPLYFHFASLYKKEIVKKKRGKGVLTQGRVFFAA